MTKTFYATTSLGHNRAESSRDHRQTYGRKYGEHGVDNLENAPAGKILKPDVSIAKNYLNEKVLNQPYPPKKYRNNSQK
jgi:hypothetical protein